MAKVSVSTQLPAPADKVWSLIGGWNTVPDWHPGVEKSETEQGGQVRRLQLTDGAEVIERLEKFDKNARTYTYSITASSLPFRIIDRPSPFMRRATAARSIGRASSNHPVHPKRMSSGH